MKNIKRIEKNEGELTFFEIFAVTDFFFLSPYGFMVILLHN